MEGQENKDYMLSGIKVLDLADEKGMVCGKLLGDFGADVIKIEPPGGDPARNIGPFYKDTPHPEKSLFWFANNTSKRGITLNLETPTGQELFRRLVKNADVVVESFSPGYMASLGLSYDDLCQVRPDIIMTSVSPFGQTGPFAHYRATDLVLQGAGGFQYLSGDRDRPPVRPSAATIAPQSGAEAAAGTMFALYNREMTGEGQYVDVSMQLVSAWQLMNASMYAPLHKTSQARQGGGTQYGNTTRSIWQCKDGFTFGGLGGGPGGVVSATAVVKWMAEDGMASEWLQGFEWLPFDFVQQYTVPENQVLIDRMQGELEAFLMTKTKSEVWERSFQDRILAAPCNTIQDVVEWDQMKARGYYVELEHSELKDSITYTGHVARFNNAAQGPRFRAPLIGEHNQEVYGELGLSQQDLVALKQAGVI